MRVKVLQERLIAAAQRAGFQVQIYGQVGAFELPVFIRAAAPEAPKVYVSAGVHGDEPAGPMAVLELLRNRLFPETLNLTILPLLNPIGLERGTRENGEGIDLNRDYGSAPRATESGIHKKWLEGRMFDSALCLHEDFEATGGYIYELSPLDQPSEAQPLLKAMEPFVGIDPAEEIDGMPAAQGLMAPPRDQLVPDREDLPEALLLFFRHGCRRVYTIETPSSQNIVHRIAAQRAAVLAALSRLSLPATSAT